MTSRQKPQEKIDAGNSVRQAKRGMTHDSPLPSGYLDVLEDIKARVRAARVKASLSINRELIILYWEIGRLILRRQEAEGWGAKVIDRLSVDLNREFPDQKGFSARNLKYMRKFVESYIDREIVQQTAAQIPWFHNCTILDKVQHAEEREWYMRATIGIRGSIWAQAQRSLREALSSLRFSALRTQHSALIASFSGWRSNCQNERSDPNSTRPKMRYRSYALRRMS